MRKSIKICISILLVGVVFFLLICTNLLYKSKKSTEIANEEKNVISIYNSFGEDDEKNMWLNKIIDDYTDSKNIDISNVTLPDVEFYKKLNMDLVTNSYPDIIITRPEKRIEDLCLKGKVVSLNQEFENDESWYDFFDKSAFRYTIYGDKIYGIPMTTEYLALFYNKELFEKFGLQLPKTLEDLKYVVQVFNNNNIIPFAYSAKDDALYQAILSSVGDSETIDMGLNYDSIQIYSKAMEVMRDLYLEKSFPENFEMLSKSESMELLYNDKAAMYVGDADFIRYIEYNKKFHIGIKDDENKFGVSFFADIDGDEVRTKSLTFDAGELTIFILNKKGVNNYEKVLDFVKYLTSEKNAIFLQKNIKNKSTIKNIEILTGKKQLEIDYRILETQSTEFIRMPKTKIDGYIWNKYMMENLVEVMKGNMKPEGVCKEIIEKQNNID